MAIETLTTPRHKEFTDNIYDINELSNDILSPPSRTTLSGIHSAYYRSKLFSIDTHINPLVSAASPLLAIASALKDSLSPQDLQRLYQDLCHEIKAFENKAQAHNYRSPIILAARYALCALLDEIILTTAWGSKSIWRTQNLLNTFQREAWGGERFFVILERSSEDPVIHIDLLELMYICLNMGYEGKYQHLERGYQQLTEIIDTLYEVIQQQRGEFSQKLFLQHPVATLEQATSKRWSISTWLTILMTPLLLLIIYCGLNFLISMHATTLYQELNQLQKANSYSSLHSSSTIMANASYSVH